VAEAVRVDVLDTGLPTEATQQLLKPNQVGSARL